MTFKQINQTKKTEREKALLIIRTYIKSHKYATVKSIDEHLNFNGIHISPRTLLRYRVIINNQIAETQKLKLKSKKPENLQKLKIETGYIICPICGNRIKLSKNPIAIVGCSGGNHYPIGYYPNDKIWRYDDGKIYQPITPHHF